MKPIRVALLIAGAALLIACSKNKNIDPPAELTDFKSSIQVQRAWSAGVGGGEPKLRLGLGIAVDGDRAFAASHDGDVAAFSITNGKRLWRVTATGPKLGGPWYKPWGKKAALPFAGGPGAGGGLVVVGSTFGDIVAFDAATGAERWRTRVNSEVLSAPAVDEDLVVVRSVDGRVVGLSAADGSQRWSAEQQVPRLSLRGAATPVIAGDIVVCGFDNGRMLGLNRRDGSTLWEVTVSPPSGRTELQRLNDIDSAVRVAGDDLYVVSFQGRIARVGRETGQVSWTREMSSYRGLAVDEDAVYVATSAGEVVKIGRRTGVEMWRQKVLSHRRLSAPVVLGTHVVVADLDGYLHFLDAEKGELAARIGSGGDKVSNPPVVVGDEVVVINDEGSLSAFRIRAPKG
jgi:outer membrane protein assembly factor BamB